MTYLEWPRLHLASAGEPLLPLPTAARLATKSNNGESSRWKLEACIKELHEEWSNVVSAGLFSASAQGARNHWGALVPVLVLASLTCDCLIEGSWVQVESDGIALLLVAITLWAVPRHWLLADLLVTTSVQAGVAVAFLIQRSSGSKIMCDTAVVHCFVLPFYLALMRVRTVVLGPSILLLSFLPAFLSQDFPGAPAITLGLSSVCCCACVECISAQTFLLKVENRQIFESTRMPACSIDIRSGVVLEANKHLEALFEGASMTGRRFTDLFQFSGPERPEEQLRQLASEAAESCGQDVTVTYTPPGERTNTVFRIAPYSKVAHVLKVVVQASVDRRISEVDFSLSSDMSSLATSSISGNLPRLIGTPAWTTTTPSTRQHLSDVATQTGIEEHRQVPQDSGHQVSTSPVQASLSPLAASTSPPPPPAGPGLPSSPVPPLQFNRPACASEAFSGHDDERGGAQAPGIDLAHAVPMLSNFPLTTPHTLGVSILWAMKHWNLPRSGRQCCCPFHASALVTKRLTARFLSRPCDPLWSSFTGWYCQFCTSMNHEQAERCDMCGQGTREAASRSWPDPMSSRSSLHSSSGWGTETSSYRGSEASEWLADPPTGDRPFQPLPRAPSCNSFSSLSESEGTFSAKFPECGPTNGPGNGLHAKQGGVGQQDPGAAADRCTNGAASNAPLAGAGRSSLPPIISL